MAGTLTFNIGEVRVLMAHTKAATAHAPSYDDLFNPKCHKGGRIVEKDGWPDRDNIDPSTIPAGLWLVKDHGVYLMVNSDPGLPRAEDPNRAVVVYAQEADPERSDRNDWYEAAARIMGGDDCVITLPVELFDAATKGKSDTDVFRLKVTATSISVKG